MQKIKEKIKETIFYYMYLLLLNKLNKIKNVNRIKYEISKKYKKEFGRELNWNCPKTYNEKINVSKLYCATPEKTMLTDKLLVRDWVKSKIGEEYLIPIIKVYDRFKDINFDELPDKFVIKMNNDSGSTVICENKKNLNKKILKKKYFYYTKRNFAFVGYEMQYRDIKPKIMIEKYMGNNINDYKFQCFEGKVAYCGVDYNRFGNHKRNYFDIEWNKLPFEKGNVESTNYKQKKPENLDKMLEIVSVLSKGFDQVRVDLYDINNKIYFGEMTFTSGNGFSKMSPNIWDEKIGKMWNLKM